MKDSKVSFDTIITYLNDDFFGDKFQKSLTKGSKWYIISSIWVNQCRSQINQSSTNPPTLSQISSEDIIDPNPLHIIKQNYILKGSASFHKDYKVVPSEVWKSLKTQFGCIHKIPRYVIQKPDNSIELEINLQKIPVFIIKDAKILNPLPYNFFFSLLDSMSKITSELKSFTLNEKINSSIFSHRLWRAGKEVTINQLKNILNQTENFIEFPGHRVESLAVHVIDLKLMDEDLFVYEFKSGYSSKFLLREKLSQICRNCSKQSNDGVECKCHNFYFCCCICLNLHLNTVILETKKKSSNQLKSRLNNEEIRSGFIGLRNIGNTCYLNSGLQCLFHTKPLFTYTNSFSYLSDLRSDYSTNLFSEFAGLIQHSQNETSPASTYNFKLALSQYASQFYSNIQQDCQEFLSFLLDGLHEEVNTKSPSEIVEIIPECKNKTDEELKEIYWQNFKIKNNSIIIDIMHGQLKSELMCPDCKQITLSFDPFSMISLPIPDNSLKIIYFVLVNPESCLMGKLEITKESLVSDIRIKISQLLDLEEFELAELSNGYFVKFLSDDKKVKKRSTVLVYKKNLSKNEFIDEDFKYVVLSFKTKSNNGSLNKIGKPHLILTDICSSLKDLYCQVLEYTLVMRNIKYSSIAVEFNKRLSSYASKSYLNTDEFKLIFDEHFNCTCPNCYQVNCSGCLIKCTTDLVAQYFLSTTERFLRITVVLSNKVKEIECFDRLDFHWTCDLKDSQKSNLSLADCFELFYCTEQLDDENSIFCSSCKKNTKILKTLEIVRLPQILIIHLKRFQKRGLNYFKNNASIDYPIENLDLGKFSQQSGVYSLYSVVEHHGTLNCGHYTSICKGSDLKWRLFDDDIVKPATSIISSSAYILFYELISK